MSETAAARLTFLPKPTIFVWVLLTETYRLFWGLLTWLTGTCSLFSGFADGNLPTFFGCADGNLQTVFGFADGNQCGALRAPVASNVAGVAGHDATLRTSVEL